MTEADNENDIKWFGVHLYTLISVEESEISLLDIIFHKFTHIVKVNW